ncbi:MAG: DNA gyrase inhibitor YacG [Rhodovarius sp.]|nr:DNA gyrase inhibitor YacG [Rhodovarius sp.]MCX7931655.1 DNA gyrase inhibitor YacG [Rhodovarius sp.]MDW8314161.1 DNA gyrase inhibitor YacG [Rhodovarius sp.]
MHRPSSTDERRAGAQHRPCPICGRPAAPRPLAPFCSERCRRVDLARWLTEAYRLPGREEEPS